MLNQFLFLIAVIVVVLLSLTAWIMWRKVWHAEKQQQAMKLKESERQKQHQAYLIESIQVICTTLLREEMNISEGAIRLGVLLDNLEQLPVEKESLEPIRQLYLEVSQFDILKQRAELPKQERMAQDLARMKIEARMQDKFLAAVRKLHDGLKPEGTVH